MDFVPVIISIKTACAAIALTFFLGLWAASYINAIKNRYLKTFLDCLLSMPLVLPPTVAGFILLIIFGVHGPAGKFFLDFFAVKIAFSWEATVIAAVAISFPLMYRAARGALRQVDPVFTEAARTLGMSEGKIFFTVVFPQAAPGIAAGAATAFARGLGEFGATIMLAGNIAGRTRTLPLAIYSEVAAGNFDEAMRYCLIIIIFCFIITGIINYLSEIK